MAPQEYPSQIHRLAIDGKILRGTGRTDGKPLNLSLVTHQLRTTLRSVAIEEKCYEPSRREASEIGCAKRRAAGPTERERGSQIPAIKPLLRGHDLKCCTVTAEAMHCQQKTARFLTQELGGDYIFGLKGNQSGILDHAWLKLSPAFQAPQFTLGRRILPSTGIRRGFRQPAPFRGAAEHASLR